MEKTRSKDTESRYLRRALWMEEHVAQVLGITDPDPREVAAFAIECRAAWSRSNWRQVKASLIYRYTEMNTAQAIQAVHSLRACSQTPCLKKSYKTSALRQKFVTDDDLIAILGAIRRTRSRYAEILERWLTMGAIFGLRPHEWQESQVVWMRPSEASLVESIAAGTAGASAGATQQLPGVPWLIGAPDGGITDDAHPSHQPGPQGDQAPPADERRWHLRVKNGKHTNGRGHGHYRHLDLSECEPTLRAEVAEFAHLMGMVARNDLYGTYYKACSTLLYRCNVKLGRRGGKFIQLYSVRHKFSSVAKNAFSKQEVGALMGHATDQTATGHYGRRAHGSSGRGVRPASIEVDRVMIKSKAYPKGAFTDTVQPAPGGASSQ